MTAREKLLKHIGVPAGIGQPWWRTEIAVLALEAAIEISEKWYESPQGCDIADEIRALAEELRRG